MRRSSRPYHKYLFVTEEVELKVLHNALVKRLEGRGNNVLSTGIWYIDKFLDGGLLQNGLIGIAGDSKSGKSTFLFMLVGQVENAILFTPCGQQYDKSFVELLLEKNPTLHVVDITNPEALPQLIEEVLSSGLSPDLLLIDGMNVMSPDRRTSYARVSLTIYQELAKIAHAWNTPIIITEDSTLYKSRSSVLFDQFIRMKAHDDHAIWSIEKTPLCPSRPLYFFVGPAYGVDYKKTLLALGTTYGLIQNISGRYYYGEEFVGHGIDQALARLNVKQLEKELQGISWTSQ